MTVTPARPLPALVSWPSMTAADPALIGLLTPAADSCTWPADGDGDGEGDDVGVGEADRGLETVGRGLAGACVDGAGLPGPGELAGPPAGLKEWWTGGDRRGCA